MAMHVGLAEYYYVLTLPAQYISRNHMTCSPGLAWHAFSYAAPTSPGSQLAAPIPLFHDLCARALQCPPNEHLVPCAPCICRCSVQRAGDRPGALEGRGRTFGLERIQGKADARLLWCHPHQSLACYTGLIAMLTCCRRTGVIGSEEDGGSATGRSKRHPIVLSGV